MLILVWRNTKTKSPKIYIYVYIYDRRKLHWFVKNCILCILNLCVNSAYTFLSQVNQHTRTSIDLDRYIYWHFKRYFGQIECVVDSIFHLCPFNFCFSFLCHSFFKQIHMLQNPLPSHCVPIFRTIGAFVYRSKLLKENTKSTVILGYTKVQYS